MLYMTTWDKGTQTYLASNTGKDYLFHKLSAPAHYWDFIKKHHWAFKESGGVVEIYDSKKGYSEDRKVNYRDYCAYHWDRLFRDVEHIGFLEKADADKRVFVEWNNFYRDCLQQAGLIDNYNKLFEEK